MSGGLHVKGTNGEFIFASRHNIDIANVMYSSKYVNIVKYDP